MIGKILVYQNIISRFEVGSHQVYIGIGVRVPGSVPRVFHPALTFN